MKHNFLTLSILVSAFALSGFAETLTIKVPFEFTAAGKTLPAGEYTFQEDTAGVMIVTGSTPNSSMLMLMRGGDYSGTLGKAAVQFNGAKSITCIQMPDGKKLEVVGMK
jgi:hypothetical protein